MIELKTLKDIEDEEEKDYDKVGEDYSGWSTIERIKKEAIKWVKKSKDFFPNSWRNRCAMMISFHNITEEDLN